MYEDLRSILGLNRLVDKIQANHSKEWLGILKIMFLKSQAVKSGLFSVSSTATAFKVFGMPVEYNADDAENLKLFRRWLARFIPKSRQ